MRSLYISQQGCYVSLRQEMLLVKQGTTVLESVQLPLLDQILVFGTAQLTTQAMRACLSRHIPIAFLSRMGYCYGRLLPLERGYRRLARFQQMLHTGERLVIARQMVWGKLKNSRVLLMRQQQRRDSPDLTTAIQALDHFADNVRLANSHEQLLGLEGAGAATYFKALGSCILREGFTFAGRTRRPPTNPVNALLSFGYQVLWNHLLALIELQDLDPYESCLHQSGDRHPALASDLLEEFRAPIVDSLTLYLVNRGIVDADKDFEYRDGGCLLNNSGRKKYLSAFLQRMEEQLHTANGLQPRWELLTQQVRAYKAFVYAPAHGYQPYLTR
uniref:CRISPR-associated endonuclease Cas1 n=1 Tax=Cyanothece sp. (strain PCC 7425 / ATCC 29141) TaxID=395961 RepID=B8HYV1_CYAP4